MLPLSTGAPVVAGTAAPVVTLGPVVDNKVGPVVEGRVGSTAPGEPSTLVPRRQLAGLFMSGFALWSGRREKTSRRNREN